jgi:DNA-binding LytR/AlgR family response regulator
MTKTRILIVEDDPEQAEELTKFLDKAGYELTAIADNLKDALGYFYSQQPDIVIVDIYLHGQPEGITFAQRLNENEATKRPFIFLTQNADLNTFHEARLTSPYSYLLKPFNHLELQYAIELAIEKFAQETGAFTLNKRNAVVLEKDLFVKRGDSLIKVPFQDINYVEVEGKYSNVVSKQGIFLVQLPLKKLEERLRHHQFIRIHRNYVVNINAIQKVHLGDQLVILENQTTIPISVGFKQNLVNHLDILK